MVSVDFPIRTRGKALSLPGVARVGARVIPPPPLSVRVSTNDRLMIEANRVQLWAAVPWNLGELALSKLFS